MSYPCRVRASSRDRMSSSVLPFLSSRSISVFDIYDEHIHRGGWARQERMRRRRAGPHDDSPRSADEVGRFAGDRGAPFGHLEKGDGAELSLEARLLRKEWRVRD